MYMYTQYIYKYIYIIQALWMVVESLRDQIARVDGKSAYCLFKSMCLHVLK